MSGRIAHLVRSPILRLKAEGKKGGEERRRTRSKSLACCSNGSPFIDAGRVSLLGVPPPPFQRNTTERQVWTAQELECELCPATVGRHQMSEFC